MINLRATDVNIHLLRRTVLEYTEYLQFVSNAVDGYDLYPPSDELTARVQLENAQASLIPLGVARAQYAHAIAVLVGKNLAGPVVKPEFHSFALRKLIMKDEQPNGPDLTFQTTRATRAVAMTSDESGSGRSWDPWAPRCAYG